MGCAYISQKGRDERYLSEFIHYDDLYAIEPSTLLLEVVDRSIAFPFTSLIVMSPEQADVDGNGTIDYVEFISATMHMNRLEKEDHIYKAFEYFDKDHSG